MRVDGPTLNIVILVLKTIGQQHPYHVLYLLLCDKVQLELLEEEVSDQAIHLDGLRVLGEPLGVVIHQGDEPVPGGSVVTLE